MRSTVGISTFQGGKDVKRAATLAALTAITLMSLPVAAQLSPSNNAFIDSIEQFTAFKKARDVQTGQPHKAKFEGHFTFIEVACLDGVNSDGTPFACECPKGNASLQCLKSATATIYPDTVDRGGRGYVMLLANDGKALSVWIDDAAAWLPQTQFRNGKVSAMIPVLGQAHALQVPIPSRESLRAMCQRTENGEENKMSLTLAVGYGAVMPEEIDFVEKLKRKSDDLKQPFDDRGYLWSRARQNGYRTTPQKTAVIGVVACNARPKQTD